MQMLIPGPGWEIFLEARAEGPDEAVEALVEFYLGEGEREPVVGTPVRLPPWMEGAGGSGRGS